MANTDRTQALEQLKAAADRITGMANSPEQVKQSVTDLKAKIDKLIQDEAGHK